MKDTISFLHKDIGEDIDDVTFAHELHSHVSILNGPKIVNMKSKRKMFGTAFPIEHSKRTFRTAIIIVQSLKCGAC